MAENEEQLQERTVLINGIEHTMMLNDEDAKRYEQAEASRPEELRNQDQKARQAPANKSRDTEDK